MKKITVIIDKGKVNLDFHGFEGDACSAEENVIKVFYQKLGVNTDVEHSDNKREAEAETTAIRERIQGQ
jgi:hypothetical protein